jgi:pimeloyl-ACP methyl ester carboxylesterase
MDSLDQNAKGIPVNSIELNGSKLTFAMTALRASYEGTVNKDFTAIEGTFTQGAPLPLKFKRPEAADLAGPRRPQNPVKPYPYREEDLAYDNPAAGIKLGATLTLPNGPGPFPAVILITGSGQQDRDESLLGHKPFLVLADYLTRKGIAVLRSDDRGIGKSGGAAATATTADFATDTEAAVAYLKTRREIDPHKIGLAGHSEGGVIAPMVAARNKDVAFIVLIAGPGVPGDQIIMAQVVGGAEAAGIPRPQVQEAEAAQRKLLDLVMKEKDEAARKQKFTDILGARAEAAYSQMMSPWYRYFLSYDPAPALRKVACPVLAINGEKDTQVPAKPNLRAIREALEQGDNKSFETVEMPGLNHLLQTAKTGAVSEYGEIEETIAPSALEKIAAWITAAVSKK